jgi:hypothetical protein
MKLSDAKCPANAFPGRVVAMALETVPMVRMRLTVRRPEDADAQRTPSNVAMGNACRNMNFVMLLLHVVMLVMSLHIYVKDGLGDVCRSIVR